MTLTLIAKQVGTNRDIGLVARQIDRTPESGQVSELVFACSFTFNSKRRGA